ncbi:hypothetical protein ABPG77_010166 [Micractinium sp. CCAP 211/92]
MTSNDTTCGNPSALTLVANQAVTVRSFVVGARHQQPLPITLRLTDGNTTVDTVISDASAWPENNFTDFLYLLSSPFTFPAGTNCTLAVLPSNSTADSYFEFAKLSQQTSGTLPDEECFPAEATLEVEGRGTMSMEHLRTGDRVLAMDHATGHLAYRPLYIFVHREPQARATFVNVEATTLGTQDSAARRLQLSRRHFLPVCASGDAAACGTPRLGGLADSLRSSLATWQQRYGQDVRPGMLVLVADGTGAPVPARVQRVWLSTQQGLFNPLVEGGIPVVNGMLASDQSSWVLDDAVPASWRAHLPAVYGLVMSPLRLLFHLLGPAGLEKLDTALGITYMGHHHGKRLLAALPATAAAALAAVAVGRLSRRQHGVAP